MCKSPAPQTEAETVGVPYDKVYLVDQASCQSPYNIGILDMTSQYGNMIHGYGVCVSGEMVGKSYCTR